MPIHLRPSELQAVALSAIMLNYDCARLRRKVRSARNAMYDIHGYSAATREETMPNSCGDSSMMAVKPIVHEVQTKNPISRSALADYAVNPYAGCTHACMYCYAAAMRRRTAHPEPWGEYLDVKSWPPIRNPGKYSGKRIVVGSVTDPYQPHEAVYGKTRLFLEQMRESGADIGIITKSDLILRDLVLIRSIPGAHVTFSINTLDEEFRADMDRAAPIARRLNTMRQFHDAGVPPRVLSRL